jgi:hypothetical protein
LKKSLFSIGTATLLAMASITAKAQDEGLVYVATDPCRIVDTRGGGGAITADTSRNFASYGQDLSGQGGGTCPRPRPFSQPVAISAYVIAVPPNANSGSGVLTAYPAGNPVPPVGEGSTVNFAAQQIIGNTTTITLGNASQFAVLARQTDQHVVVDVQGYFYAQVGSCENDMVAVGSLCVDKYEASLVDSGGAPTDGTACDVSGSDCAGVIFANSVAGATPASNVSWYQAAQACANVGKRLPTTAEWQMAASGTPAGTVDCNGSGTIALTGASATCVSNTGANDMVGNLWEFSADLDTSQQASGSGSTDDLQTVSLGCSYNTGTCNNDPSTSSLFVLVNGPDNPNPLIGFRCAR